jgi:predicted esterase
MHENPPIELDLGQSSGWVVVLAHGRGRSPAHTEELARRLDWPARYVLLQADGSTWYPDSFIAPLERNEPGLSAALAHYERAVSGVIASGVAPERIVVGGFSQGACLTSEWLARHPRRLGAALVFTGGRIAPPDTPFAPTPALAGTPVYLGSSRDDTWVPDWRVEETTAWLRASGADATLTMFETREHLVSDQEVDEARALLAGLGG